MNDKEIKWSEECRAVGLTLIEKAGGKYSGYSVCSCNVCGHVDYYVQGHIRRGKVKCSNCQEIRWREECKAVGLMWLSKVDRAYSMCSCVVCGHVDDYQQVNIRRGKVRCSHCHKYKSE